MWLTRLIRRHQNITSVFDIESARGLGAAGEFADLSIGYLHLGSEVTASIQPFCAAVERLTVSPSQIASQILGAGGQSVTRPVAIMPQVKVVKTIEKKEEKSVSGAAFRILTKIEKWCAMQVSNQLLGVNQLIRPCR